MLSLDNVEERADVGMVDLRDESRFPLEAGETICIIGECCREDLDGDVSSKTSVARAVHLAHGAVAQQADDLVRPQSIARVERHRGGNCAADRRCRQRVRTVAISETPA